jgi:hypothetical protein
MKESMEQKTSVSTNFSHSTIRNLRNPIFRTSVNGGQNRIITGDFKVRAHGAEAVHAAVSVSGSRMAEDGRISGLYRYLTPPLQRALSPLLLLYQLKDTAPSPPPMAFLLHNNPSDRTINRSFYSTLFYLLLRAATLLFRAY